MKRAKFSCNQCIKGKFRIRIFTSFLHIIILTVFSQTIFSQSTEVHITEDKKDTIIVYKDVPDLSPSDKYSIRVKSRATNNIWIDCFANITINKAHLVEPLPGKWGATRNYALLTTGWSHTYGNFEMSKNSLVEVEITSKNDFKINGAKFYKATTHPNSKASLASVDSQGVVRFTISEPGQITIDINGQMDDYKPKSDVLGANVLDSNRDRVHTISIFANPILKKPSINDPLVQIVEPGIKPSSDLGTKSILYFKPGVHNLGMDFKLQPGKQYYIPGDAIVFATFNTLGQPTLNGLAVGEKIKIFGYGTVSGEKFNHPDYDEKNYTPTEDQKKPYKPFHIDAANSTGIEGVCIVDSAYHSVHLNGNSNYCKWVKVITWRGNGDGIGSCKLTEDCFLRTNDDCAYIKGNKKRCIFWKDAGGAVFHMAGIPENTPLVIEDCDVLYLRGLFNGGAGKGIFVQRGRGTVGQRSVNVLFKNFRVHDKYPNQNYFSLVSNDDGSLGSSYKGITFENFTAVSAYEAFGPGKSEKILGTIESSWNGGIAFDCVKIGGKLVSIDNFITNDYVSNITFKCSNLNISDNSQLSRNSILLHPNPITNILQINFFKENDNREIKIFNLLGQMVYATKTVNKEVQIDMQSLNLKGVVIVQVIEGDVVSDFKVIVK